MDKALASGAVDLVLFVLSNIKMALPLLTFFRTVTARSVASALVEASVGDVDEECPKTPTTMMTAVLMAPP